MDKNSEKLGHYLTTIRESNNISYDKMSNLLHVSERTIRRWENAEATPSIYDIINICDEFHIPLEEFMASWLDSYKSDNSKEVYNDRNASESQTEKRSSWIREKAIIWAPVLIIVCSLLLACFFYMRAHNYIISTQSYNGGQLGCYPEVEKFNISIKSDGKTMIIAISNYSDEDMDFYRSSTGVPSLLRAFDDGWHNYHKEYNPVRYMENLGLVRKGSTEIITVDCIKSYGGMLPSGTYRIEFVFEGIESGRHTYVAEFIIP